MDRDPAAVLLDVRRGLVSVESARDDYGVLFLPTDDDYELELDVEATEAQRAEIRAERPPLKLFDRGANFYRLVEEGKITLTSSDEALAPAG